MMTGTSSYVNKRNEALLILVGKWDHCSRERKKRKTRDMVQHRNKDKWTAETAEIYIRLYSNRIRRGGKQYISSIEVDVLIETTQG